MERTRGGGVGLDLALLVVALLLAVSVALGWLLVRDDADRRAADAAEQEQYAAVMAAARREADALANVRHDDGGTSLERVAAGATGDLLERYADREAVLERLARDRTVAAGSVVEVGVVTLRGDEATALAAVDGTVASRATDDEPVARDTRLRLDLVLEDDGWLVADVEVVD